jgi:hypothetical protein
MRATSVSLLLMHYAPGTHGEVTRWHEQVHRPEMHASGLLVQIAELNEPDSPRYDAWSGSPLFRDVFFGMYVQIGRENYDTYQ